MPPSAALFIRHDIPGRLRLRVSGLGRKPPGPSPVRDLEALSGMLCVRVNERCSALVLRYDPRVLPRRELLARLDGLFPEPHEAPACREAGADCPCGSRDEVVRQGRRFAGLSAMVGVVFVRSTVFGARVAQGLFTPLGLAVLAFGLPLARKGLRDLRRGRPGLDAFLAGGVMASLAGGQALTALEILWINSGAELLTAWIAERSRRHISRILELTSHHTFVLVDGVEMEREVADLEPGDVVVLHTGEKISVDGPVVHGQALVNEAPITGRQDFVHKREGDTVFAGTFVREGVIRVRAERVGDATYLARVMHKVQDALETRAPIEGVADRLAARLVGLGFAATGATLVLTGSLWRAYTVLLIMACPCATVLAASTAVSAAMNAAARNHILIKGGRYLEEAGKCRTVFFDKTGTLTTTEPRLVSSVSVDGVDETGLLELAASVETHNHHPLARAVMAEAGRRGIEPVPHDECDYHMGMGMRAMFGSDEVLVGNAKLADHYGMPRQTLEERAEDLRGQGLTVLYVHKNGLPLGLLGFEAQERPEARAVVRSLRSQGVERIVLITGDEDATARNLAERLELDAYHASVMPEEKADIVGQASGARGPVLMVGDGINDALALTRADVGVAFGTGGSEVAVEAADIALVREDLAGLTAVHAQGSRAVRVAHENFWIATGSNIVGVVLGGLGILTPVTAGLVHVAHSLGVLANSSRLLRLPPGRDSKRTQGDKNGFQDLGQAEAISGNQAPRAGTDSHRVPAGHGR